MAKKELLIFGAGRHAVKVVETALAKGMKMMGFISTEPPGTIVNGYPVLGYIDLYKNDHTLQETHFHIAIGENSVRYDIYTAIEGNRLKMVSMVDGNSDISASAVIGAGTYIGKRVVVQNHASTGIGCLIDTGAIIEHGVRLGDFVTISPGAVLCGDVTLQRGAVIGAGATVIEKVTIGENSLIGAGSVVLHDIEANVVAVGNPARVVRKRKFEERYLR